MPRAWNRKDERMYKHILSSCKGGRKRRSTKVCKRIAASTVNKQRRREGRTLSGWGERPRSWFDVLALPVFVGGMVTVVIPKIAEEQAKASLVRIVSSMP